MELLSGGKTNYTEEEWMEREEKVKYLKMLQRKDWPEVKYMCYEGEGMIEKTNKEEEVNEETNNMIITNKSERRTSERIRNNKRISYKETRSYKTRGN